MAKMNFIQYPHFLARRQRREKKEGGVISDFGFQISDLEGSN
jgi:hypothetical protein